MLAIKAAKTPVIWAGNLFLVVRLSTESAERSAFAPSLSTLLVCARGFQLSNFPIAELRLPAAAQI